ncbi:hypothetical protein AYI70_g7246 [Smittium culicis]|uniref:Uncharacterized protein n=1 Tax=Smittium culicis TaxID=133412 RepID=A0A1R1XLH1_9FUNG|nr:hypothetical protein AYI70_g10413 [Smittium culicis]OMJ12872.1 hypothetical protein AYI70_g8849 [Smittium culicis]OMJ15481.1 hypothetical protein AYI70_g7246 [Smittium culicis]
MFKFKKLKIKRFGRSKKKENPNENKSLDFFSDNEGKLGDSNNLIDGRCRSELIIPRLEYLLDNNEKPYYSENEYSELEEDAHEEKNNNYASTDKTAAGSDSELQNSDLKEGKIESERKIAALRPISSYASNGRLISQTQEKVEYVNPKKFISSSDVKIDNDLNRSTGEIYLSSSRGGRDFNVETLDGYREVSPSNINFSVPAIFNESNYNTQDKANIVNGKDKSRLFPTTKIKNKDCSTDSSGSEFGYRLSNPEKSKSASRSMKPVTPDYEKMYESTANKNNTINEKFKDGSERRPNSIRELTRFYGLFISEEKNDETKLQNKHNGDGGDNDESYIGEVEEKFRISKRLFLFISFSRLLAFLAGILAFGFALSTLKVISL